MSSSGGGMSLGVGDFGGRHRPLAADQRVDPGGSQLRDEPLEQRARVEVGQRRASMTVLEMSGAEILTARMRFSGFRVGSVRRPWAASAARRASRLAACFADLIGVSRAIGLPRSVTMISSPCLVRRKYRVRPFLSSLTPTVAMMSPCSYSSYLPKASIARWCSRKCGATPNAPEVGGLLKLYTVVRSRIRSESVNAYAAAPGLAALRSPAILEDRPRAASATCGRRRLPGVLPPPGFPLVLRHGGRSDVTGDSSRCA